MALRLAPSGPRRISVFEQSRSDCARVAVDFSPRIMVGKGCASRSDA